MAKLLNSNPAFGAPGIPPRWTRSDKEGVGTAYSSSSPVWFSVSAGVLNEVYYPTIDRPQIRDLQFMVSDGETFCHDERRHTHSTTERLCRDSLGYRVVNKDSQKRYHIEKEIISAPDAACVLMNVKFVPAKKWRGHLKLFALLAPHLDGGGWGNTAQVVEANGASILVASKNGLWLALGCTVPFIRCSCGYVGTSDGWQDLNQNRRLDWQFDIATDGNVAMVGEIPVDGEQVESQFTLGLAFSDHLHGALTSLFQSLAIPFADQKQKFQQQWERTCGQVLPLEKASGDGGQLYRTSHSLLLAHEDKTYHGAMIASLSIPWGESKGDDDLGGYHLVWTRDMVNSATGLLASGNTETPFRALVYLACAQQADGGFHQNFWIDGEPYWTGVQLDEVAFPILLAWKLSEAGCLRDFDPWPMVRAAAAYLIRKGPATPQERWEENSGYSPSTLASNIAALVCASMFADGRGEAALARYLRQYADFLECHVEAWTVTNQGTLVDGIKEHYIRLHPVDMGDPSPNENPNEGTLWIKNRAPGLRAGFPAKEIVDAGFLELVRYGIRKPEDRLIKDSLLVVDEILKVDTPSGPCWRRYNHDGYGQRTDGGPFDGWGRGRSWPLLSGERAHYELAAGNQVTPLLVAIESFANSTGHLPEQIWDAADLPDIRMFCGKPSGSAMPLMWAHAEYTKLLRSINDGVVFDRIDAVARRYLENRGRATLDIWKFNRQVAGTQSHNTLRVQAHAPFRLRFTNDHWQTHIDRASTDPGIEVHYCDIQTDELGPCLVEFTFFWVADDRWEGKNYQVQVVGSPS
jgi:glucoamylase